MIDVADTVRDYLLTQSAVTSLTSTRIYAERDVPPKGYKPSDGGAIVLKTRGGTIGGTQGSAHVLPSMQFKCYGLTEVVANNVYLALVDALHDKRPGALMYAGVEVLGQTLEEPNTKWPFVLTFFKLTALRSA